MRRFRRPLGLRIPGGGPSGGWASWKAMPSATMASYLRLDERDQARFQRPAPLPGQVGGVTGPAQQPLHGAVNLTKAGRS